MDSLSDLKNISIVLVDTKTPANIGAIARCMMNMQLRRLVLVRPPLDPDGQAGKLAAGAQEVLHAAAVYPSLKDAVAGQGLVIGASRHRSRIRKNIRGPRETAREVLPLLDRNRVSLVFGNEVNGLEREDLALCHEFVRIPSSGEFPSLNISHAVMIVAYELFTAALNSPAPALLDLAEDVALENFYAHLQKTLQATGFLDQEQPDRMMFSLRQIFGRARLSSRDLSILRGVLSSVDRNTRL